MTFTTWDVLECLGRQGIQSGLGANDLRSMVEMLHFLRSSFGLVTIVGVSCALKMYQCRFEEAVIGGVGHFGKRCS